jgi:CubicO group peptidase (beta-lactamase class C family)
MIESPDAAEIGVAKGAVPGVVAIVVDSTDSMLERAAAIHARMPDDSLVAVDLQPAENPEFEMGGGGLHSTMSDYGNFMRMIRNDGELDGTRVLDADTVAQMCSNHIGELRVSRLETAAPQFSNDAEMFPGEEKSWGAHVPDPRAAGSNRTASRDAELGRSRQQLLLDRSHQRHRRRLPEPDPALRRPCLHRPLLRLRTRRLRQPLMADPRVVERAS